MSVDGPVQETTTYRLRGAVASATALSVLFAGSAVFHHAPFAPSAVAGRILRLVPGDIATFFIEFLGSWARLLLAAGALVVAFVVGVWAYSLLARRGRPGAAALPLCAVAYAGSMSSPSVPVDHPQLLAVTALAGLGYLLSARRTAAFEPGDGSEPDPARRRALRLGFSTVAAVSLGGGAVGWLVNRLAGPNTDVELVMPAVPRPVPERDFPEIAGLSDEVTSVADHYVIDINLVQPSVEASGWTLTVDGEVDEALELDFATLQERFEVVEDYSVLACVSNDVGGPLIGHSLWGGVRLADVLAAAGVSPDAVDVVFYAADGYSDSVTIERAMDPSVLVAVSQNRAPLTREHGFPCRIRIPAIYGMKNVKWLERIEVVAEDYTGYWQERGWSDDAVVKTQSRIDVAGDDRRAERGEATWIAGVAWAGDRGVSKVEVSADGGETFAEAILKEPISGASWTLWAYEWVPRRTGDVTVVCRATDGEGDTQPQAATPPHPDGAAGWHRLRVEVT